MKYGLWLIAWIPVWGVMLIPMSLHAPQVPKEALAFRRSPLGWVIVGINETNPKREKDNQAFRKRGNRLAQKMGYGYKEVTTGQHLLRTLEEISEQYGMITHTVLFCHGDSLGLFFNSDHGLYDDTVKTRPHWRRFYGLKSQKAFLSDWILRVKQNKIRFHPKAVSVWMTCGAGRMAYKLCQSSGSIIVAATGQVAPVNNLEESDETGYYVTAKHFYLYHPAETEPVILEELFSPELFLQRYQKVNEML